METKTFRGLMILSMALYIVATVIAWPTYQAEAASLPASQAEVASGLSGLQFSNQAIFGVVYSFSWIITFVIGFTGLFMFRSWGRSLSLLAALLTPLAAVVHLLAFGDQPATSREPAFALTVQYLATLTWGGVLALAYFSEIKHQFGANNSFKPKPLRGSA